MAINWGISQLISFTAKIFDNLHTTLAEQQEITQNLQGELSEVQSAISDVNSELQATANRIDELNGKDSLSFVEQEELDNLIAQNKELERRNKLLAEQEASKQQEIAESVKKEFDKKYVRQTYSRIFLQQEIDEENAKRVRYNELYSNEGHNTSEEVAEMRQLRLELDELNSVDPTASFPEHIQQTIAAYEELNQRKKSGAELTKEEENHLSKYREELINTAVDLDDYSSRYGVDDETNRLWNNLLDSMYECLYPAEHLTEKFDKVYNSLSENVQNELEEALIAAQILGADWEADILNGRLDVLNAFKNEYIRIQQEIADAALKSANEQVKTAGTADTGSKPDATKINFTEYASGTNNAKKGLNLVGEDGTEAYFDNHGHVAIVTKPTLIPMESGEVVKNERDTKKLLDPDNLAPVDIIEPADIDGKETLPDVRTLPPISLEEYIQELQQIAPALSKQVQTEQIYPENNRCNAM